MQAHPRSCQITTASARPRAGTLGPRSVRSAHRSKGTSERQGSLEKVLFSWLMGLPGPLSPFPPSCPQPKPRTPSFGGRGTSVQSQCCPLQGICLHGTFPGSGGDAGAYRGAQRPSSVGSPLSPLLPPLCSSPAPAGLASFVLSRGNDYLRSCTINQCLASFF